MRFFLTLCLAPVSMPLLASVSMLTDFLIVTLLLQLLQPVAVALTPITDTNVNAAVQLWLSNEQQARSQYGNISEWNVSAVTSLSSSKSDGWSGKQLGGDM